MTSASSSSVNSVVFIPDFACSISVNFRLSRRCSMRVAAAASASGRFAGAMSEAGAAAAAGSAMATPHDAAEAMQGIPAAADVASSRSPLIP
eukprot:6197523-Pleurochrysis_carterae.AAC.2